MGLDIRWYALAYIAAFVVGYFMFRRLMRVKDAKVCLDKKQTDDLLTAIILGVIIGGRLGYVLFYDALYFLSHPLQILAVWNGGMSFHGGLIGVICAVFLFAKKQKVNGWAILDIMSVVAPIGLFFGRIANFINREVMGRATDVPWAVVFNGDTTIPRHPSPLYEAATEGVLLFVILYTLYKYTSLRNKPGALGGIMGMGYAIFRMICEQFRAPDAQIGFLAGEWLTMGTLLSLIMFFAGFAIFMFAIRKK
ncbi:MAG: prolipoprotein diacylglyceryl transferase [Alphaproteobacteria bacterium]|nr:prolipoprotein diacylglyceryl transferase [Alphaproteobacteria bacterium]